MAERTTEPYQFEFAKRYKRPLKERIWLWILYLALVAPLLVLMFTPTDVIPEVWVWIPMMVRDVIGMVIAWHLVHRGPGQFGAAFICFVYTMSVVGWCFMAALEVLD